ncbi:hypothetical protein ACQUSR_23920 [Streptomyces sp. P1-3]|uniref:hypothetical protein n=1 Tax=Streptomyces sp. P1-3 TaxID=3421658 RepID=UPI003D368B4F
MPLLAPTSDAACPAEDDSAEGEFVDPDHANEAIRSFLRARTARPLLPEERVEYRRLLGVYLGAMRREVGTAA